MAKNFKIFSNNFKTSIASYILKLYFVFVTLTSKTVFACPNSSKKFLEGHGTSPYLFAMWHGKIFLSTYILYKIPQMKASGIYGVTSTHRDGLYVEKFLKRFGVRSIQGSSNKGGVKALTKIISLIKQGVNITITPDGPKGPRHACNGNIHNLSVKYGAPIIPMCFASTKVKVFNTWDRFCLPLPFSTIYFDIGEPIFLDSKQDSEARKQKLISIMKVQEQNVEEKAGIINL